MERRNQSEQAQETENFNLSGKVLFFTKDKNLLQAQIQGKGLRHIESASLIDRANTDQLLPSYAYLRDPNIENLGRYFGTGYEGIGKDDVENSAVQGLVFGMSAGIGSSREHVQYAMKGAGIKFVIAKSFERIFWENCRNYGILPIPFDSDVAQRLISGEQVTRADIYSMYEPLTVDILRFGGLLPYTRARLEGKVQIPQVETALRPMTIAEKIIARNTKNPSGFDGVVAVKPGDVLVTRIDKKYAYELQTIISQQVLRDTFGDKIPHIDPENTWMFEDHLALMPPDLPVTKHHRDAQRAFDEKYGLAEYRADKDGVEGICHTVMLEKHVLPGELILGNDSHTCHLGAANALALGKGAS